MSLDGQLGEGLTCGITKLYTARVCLTFRSGSTAMEMESMLQHSTCQSFGTDYKDLIIMIKELILGQALQKNCRG